MIPTSQLGFKVGSLAPLLLQCPLHNDINKSFHLRVWVVSMNHNSDSVFHFRYHRVRDSPARESFSQEPRPKRVSLPCFCSDWYNRRLKVAGNQSSWISNANVGTPFDLVPDWVFKETLEKVRCCFLQPLSSLQQDTNHQYGWTSVDYFTDLFTLQTLQKIISCLHTGQTRKRGSGRIDEIPRIICKGIFYDWTSQDDCFVRELAK